MSSIVDDEGRWCARAETARILAGQMTDPMAKVTMLKIAEGYDEMAVHALIRAAADKRKAS
jgi:hypothetical protein